MTVNLLLIAAVIVAALWTIFTARLIRSAVGLAVTSAALAVLMFRLNSPYAAAFELSVCAGLIPVIFITTIGFTKRVSKDEVKAAQRAILKRFWFMPVLMIIGLFYFISRAKLSMSFDQVASAIDIKEMIWTMRRTDLLGQAVVLLAGALGVVVFFKESKK